MADSMIDLAWEKKMRFSTNLNGHDLILDVDESSGGDDSGPRPKQLMLVALAGCTGMDVISILRKMKVDVDDLHVKVEGDLTDEHPKYYYRIHVIYEFRGTDLPMDKLEKAVSLSEDRYCGVSAVYKKVMEMTSEIKILDGPA